MLRERYHLPGFVLEEEALTQSYMPPPHPPTQILPPAERLWPSTLTKLCHSKHRFALLNEWVTSFIHDYSCQ